MDSVQLQFAGENGAARRFSSLIPPLRYGVMMVILATIGYAMLHFLPLIRRDISLLREVQENDIRGIALQGQLQYQIQESRRMLFVSLLSAPNSEQRRQKASVIRQYDATVEGTETQIVDLGVLPSSSQRRFQESWSSYVTQRDRLLDAGAENAPKSAEGVDSSLGDKAFLELESAVQGMATDFEASSSTRIQNVSHELSDALRELLLSMVIKFAALLLLIWMDFRRAKVEKQLARATRELKLSEDRFRQAYESASVGMGLFKLDGTVISSNKKAAEILGYEVEELIGMKVSAFMAPEFRADHLQKLAGLPESPDESYQSERRILRKDGTSAWVRNSVTLLKAEGEDGHVFSISEEITRQKEANDRLTYLANYDPVTNLPNRHHFEELLTASLRPYAGFLNSVALMYLEIDSFDFLKGTFGRTVADEVLGELGVALAAFRTEGEIIARLDDHVFAMLVRAAPYDERTLKRANQLRDIFHDFSELGKHKVPLSASIGVAYSSERELDAGGKGVVSAAMKSAQSGGETLLKFARAAMLEARSRGGDCIYLADPALQERAAQRHQIELALLRGLREDEFRVVFQPQFEVTSGKLVRFEALCRWTSAELGPIPPDRFIPIAEQTGLIMEIGRRVMIDALQQAKTWIGAGRRIGVAVNISPMQFMRPDFTHIVTEVLATTGFPAELLELEITEGIFIRDLNLAVARIRELQRLGLSIALDDFGTGYSSLSYLQKMPINAVKLDRSFVSDLTTDAATVSMVKSVLSMADALKLRVVTEGVETEEQLDILKSLGCDEAQGYLLGRPESSVLAFARVSASPVWVDRSVGLLA